jgi:hypothetical protein
MVRRPYARTSIPSIPRSAALPARYPSLKSKATLSIEVKIFHLEF